MAFSHEAATHASEPNAGLPATPGDATAPTPPSTGAAPTAAACWPSTLEAWAAAGAGSAGVPPDSNGAASAAAGKVDDGGPNTNGAVATAGAAAAAGAANVDGAVPKENAGMVVAAEEALLACCENPPNAVAAAGPPNAAVLLPSITAAGLCAPNKPYEPARVERDGEDPAARHDHAFTQAHARSLRGRERGATSGGEWERRAEDRGRVEVRGTGTEGKRRDRRVRSRFAHHTNTMVVVDCVCTGAATPPCLRVGSKRRKSASIRLQV